MLVKLRRIMIPPALFCNLQVPIFDKIMNNALDGTLGDLNAFGHVTYSQIGIAAYEKEHMAVIG